METDLIFVLRQYTIHIVQFTRICAAMLNCISLMYACVCVCGYECEDRRRNFVFRLVFFLSGSFNYYEDVRAYVIHAMDLNLKLLFDSRYSISVYVY